MYGVNYCKIDTSFPFTSESQRQAGDSPNSAISHNKTRGSPLLSSPSSAPIISDTRKEGAAAEGEEGNGHQISSHTPAAGRIVRGFVICSAGEKLK